MRVRGKERDNRQKCGAFLIIGRERELGGDPETYETFESAVVVTCVKMNAKKSHLT